MFLRTFICMLAVSVASLSTSYAAVPEPDFALTFEGDYTDASSHSVSTTPAPNATIANDPERGLVYSSSGATTNAFVTVNQALSGSFTKAAWIRTDTNTVNQNILSTGTGSGNDFWWVATSTSGGAPSSFRLKVGDVVSIAVTNFAWSQNLFPISTWKHVAVSFDATSKEYRLFEDGVLVGTGISTNPAPIVSPFMHVGAYRGAIIFRGKLDDVAFWSTTLSDAQIQEVAQGNLGLIGTPLDPLDLRALYGSGQVQISWQKPATIVSDYIVEYKLQSDSVWSTWNEGINRNTRTTIVGLLNNQAYDVRVRSVTPYGISTGAMLTVVPATGVIPNSQYFFGFNGDFLDISGNGKHGNPNNVNIFQDPQRGQVLVNSGSNAYVRVPNSFSGSYTKSAWIKIDNTFANWNILSTSNTTGNDVFWVNDNPSLLNGAVRTPGVVNIVRQPIVQNTWKHVAVSFDDITKEMRLYQDGSLVGTGSYTGSFSSNSQDIGGYIGANSFSGWIDDVGMWHQKLSDQEIFSLYADTATPAYSTPLAPTAPRSLSATNLSGSQVRLQWQVPQYSGNSPILHYELEYKLSSSGSTDWITFGSGNILNNIRSYQHSATASGFQMGASYDFRIRAVNAHGASIAVILANHIVRLPVHRYILSTGQSLSVGATSTPVISAVQPYNNLMLSGGVQSTGSTFVPLIETSVETPSSGMANALRSFDPYFANYIVGLHGQGGSSYSVIKKGTAPYAKGMQQLTNAFQQTQSLGRDFSPYAITVVHGESDDRSGNTASGLYRSYMEEFSRDYRADIALITGFTGSTPMFMSQMNSSLSGFIAQEQLMTHKLNTGSIMLVGPKYQYNYSPDHLHLTNTQSKHVGEMFAKAINDYYMSGSWNPLMPTDIIRSGRDIYLSYHIPRGSLVFDTTTVALRPNYGFEFTQSGGTTPVSIESVELVKGATQVRIRLSAIPDGADQKVRYAWTCYRGSIGSGFGSCGGANDAQYVGGNLRDMDERVSLSPDSTNIPLYNFSVSFEEPVQIDTTAPIVTLSGASMIQITRGQVFTDPGASWVDNVDGSGTVMASTGSVDTNVVGTYTLSYSVRDTAGNTSAVVTRTVSVVDIPRSSGGGGGGSSFSLTQLLSTNSSQSTSSGAVTDSSGSVSPGVSILLSRQKNATQDGDSLRVSRPLTSNVCIAIDQKLSLDRIITQDITSSPFAEDIAALMMFAPRASWIGSSGIVNNASLYRPDDSVTRAEFVKILVRAQACKIDLITSRASSFQDIRRVSWQSPYVETALKSQWIRGYSDGTFRPDAYITRGEAAKILARALAPASYPQTSSFSDVSQDDEFAQYISYLASEGVVSGKSLSTFDPNGYITRGEMARVIYRAYLGGQ